MEEMAALIPRVEEERWPIMEVRHCYGVCKVVLLNNIQCPVYRCMGVLFPVFYCIWYKVYKGGHYKQNDIIMFIADLFYFLFSIDISSAV